MCIRDSHGGALQLAVGALSLLAVPVQVWDDMIQQQQKQEDVYKRQPMPLLAKVVSIQYGPATAQFAAFHRGTNRSV